MLKSSLCDYSDVYILLTVTITNSGRRADKAAKEADEKNKAVVFKKFSLFAESIYKRNNTQLDNIKDFDVMM